MSDKRFKMYLLGIIIMALIAIGFCTYEAVSAHETPINSRFDSIKVDAVFGHDIHLRYE